MRASSPDPWRKPPVAEFVGIPRQRVEHRRFTLTEVRDDARSPVGRHSHDTPQICLILSNGYRTSARGVRGRCGRGTLLYHPAGTIHEDHFERRGGTFLTLHPDLRAQDNGPDPDLLPSSSQAFSGPRIELLCEQLRIESRRADACAALALECLYFEVLGVASEAAPNRHPPSWLVPTLEWVYASDVVPGVEELARFAGVHPVSFARTFRHHQGVSPGEFLRWARLQRVLPALGDTKLSLVEVALEAGFSDQSAFTRACRRVLGVTPGEYRRHMSA